MEDAVDRTWQGANQRYLTAALGVVREALERHAAGAGVRPEHEPRESGVDRPARERLAEAAAALPEPSALETLCQGFSLSEFERDVLLLCAGVDLEATFASVLAAAQGDPQRTRPTFGLALAALPGAHWSALTPGAPLRHWRMIELDAGPGLTTSPIRISERILHYLAGLHHLDEHLEGFVHFIVRGPEITVPSHRTIAERIAAVWRGADGPAPVVQLVGSEVSAKRQLAAVAAARVGLGLHLMPAHVLPSGPGEFEILVRLWEREAALGKSALLLDCEDEGPDNPVRDGLVTHFLESTLSPLIVATRDRRPLRHRPMVVLEVGRPTVDEQRVLWRDAMQADPGANGGLERLISHFDLSATAIRSASSQAFADPDRSPGMLEHRVWNACRSQARPRLENLAQRIEPVARWDDLVLPEPQKRTLREAALHVRRRATVYRSWGFAARSSRGLGISALFAGPSGTGKTMAAEVLANELDLDLFVIDLSRVVSKYIGETEKNLSRVFDAAEEGGAILLFDEADALFGKRSEVKDSHDRYANIEVSYLLQRMESYRGLAILTTNKKEALDEAFARRIRFIVQFPFPDSATRVEIWDRVFPGSTPTEGLETDRLARLNVTGGNIRNIALNAAFLAADAGEPVRMEHVLAAARGEYAKLEKPLTGEELRGWA